MSLERQAIISLTIYRMNYAVVVEGLSKQYYVYHADRPWTLHETLGQGAPPVTAGGALLGAARY